MKNRTLVIVAGALLLASFFGAAWLYKQEQAAATPVPAAVSREVLERPEPFRLGPAQAPVVITEFYDPACETCRAFYPFVKELMAQTPDKVQLILRYAPLHPGSDQVVLALEAARLQDKYIEALEMLLKTQSVWVINHQSQPDRALQQLRAIGLDMDTLQRDMMSEAVNRRVAQDVADMRTLGVKATPEFFVNGRPMPSFGYDQLQQLVRDALADTASR